MKIFTTTLAVAAVLGSSLVAEDAVPPAKHPDSSAAGWSDLFAKDLSDAKAPEGVWTVGLQGKHAGAPIYFRNLRIKALEAAK